MPTTLGWGHILLRLGLAMAAGMVVGFNRGQHGRPAGLRTMMLVCLAAALAMVLSNLLLIHDASVATTGAVRMDPLRLPLGILTGIGFLGAGAIVRRGDIVRGVTTAATLWFLTVVGLCFGAGSIALGLVSTGIAVFTLWALPIVENRMNQDRYATVVVATRVEGISEQELRRKLSSAGLQVLTLSVSYDVPEKLKVMRCNVQYHARRTMELPPQVVDELGHRPGVVKVKWR